MEMGRFSLSAMLIALACAGLGMQQCTIFKLKEENARLARNVNELERSEKSNKAYGSGLLICQKELEQQLFEAQRRIGKILNSNVSFGHEEPSGGRRDCKAPPATKKSKIKGELYELFNSPL